MPYVTRDATGSIVAVYDRPKRSAKERVRSDDPALQHFLLDPRERRMAREQPPEAMQDFEYEPEWDDDYDYEEEDPAPESETAPPPQAPPQQPPPQAEPQQPPQQAPPPQQPQQQAEPQQQAAPPAAPAPQQAAQQRQQAPPPQQADAPKAPQGAAPGGDAAASGDDGAENILVQTDFDMARISEDLIDVLIGKNIINFTDFPKPAQDKLMRRRQLRSNLSTLTSLVGDDDSIL